MQKKLHQSHPWESETIELPETIRVPLEHVVHLAIEGKLADGDINLQKNQIVLCECDNSWFIIFKNSYFAVPKDLIESYTAENIEDHNPFIRYLRHQTPKHEITHEGITVKIYSVNIPLSEIVTQGFDGYLDDLGVPPKQNGF